jgi:cytochrome c-type biogenesis protein CcmE
MDFLMWILFLFVVIVVVEYIAYVSRIILKAIDRLIDYFTK